MTSSSTCHPSHECLTYSPPKGYMNEHPPRQPSRPWPRSHGQEPGDEDSQCSQPGDFEVEDVELIWWTLASRMSKKEIRAWAKSIVSGSLARFDGFLFVPLSDSSGRGRYPRGVVKVLRQVLRPLRLMPGFSGEGAQYIEQQVWHLLTLAALRRCPPDWLPEYLWESKLGGELGL